MFNRNSDNRFMVVSDFANKPYVLAIDTIQWIKCDEEKCSVVIVDVPHAQTFRKQHETRGYFNLKCLHDSVLSSSRDCGKDKNPDDYKQKGPLEIKPTGY